jgi:hypothetical protein
VLILDLTPANAVLLEAGLHSAELTYRRIVGAGYLSVRDRTTHLTVYCPIGGGDLALIVGGQSVLIHPVQIMKGRVRLGFDAGQAVSISRSENRAQASA